MTIASRRDLEIARELLVREIRPAPDLKEVGARPTVSGQTTEALRSLEVVAAGNRVIAHLHNYLTRLFGAEGFNALLIRALSRARSEYPLLPKSMTMGPTTGLVDRINGFIEIEPGDSASQMMDALVVLIGTIISLISRLVGDDMANQFIKQIWQDASHDVYAEATQETSPAKLRAHTVNDERILE